MWYTNSYRRNLVDMHIEDWNPEFLSLFSPEDYYENLVVGKIQSPMIYLQSHVGHCYFPTRVGHMHSALTGREDMIKVLVDKCRASGMSVVGYYSLIYNTVEEDRHPEWKMHDGSGKSSRDNGGRYGLCCPNNIDYRAFVFEQIKEIAEYFTLDGMFYDMLFWPTICRCESCRKRWSEEVGGEIPVKMDWHDPNWILFARKRREWMGEFAMNVTRETKRLMPHVSVEHNYACAVAGDWSNGSSELVNDACDYAGGDLYGDLYNHSFTCKYYIGVTKNPPFEYMTCRCDNNLLQHTVTKTRQALELEIMLTCVHHGASFVIDAIDPRGTLDRRVYERIGEIFSDHMSYEPYFKGSYVADAGIFYSTASRYNPDGQGFDNKSCAVNTVRTLIQRHIPTRVLSYGSLDGLDALKFITVPALAEIEDYAAEALISYVAWGGTLYFSGAYCKGLLDELLGAKYTGQLTRETRTYIAPVKDYEGIFGDFNADYPMPVEFRLPIVETDDMSSVKAYITLPYTARDERRFASIHSDPPGIATKHPALIVKRYGKGNVIWSAAPIEQDGRVHSKRLLMELIGQFVPPQDYSMRSDAPINVELVAFDAGGSVLISAVDLTCGEQRVVNRPFGVSVRTKSPVSGVVRLPLRTPVDFESEGGMVNFQVDALDMFAMYQIIL
ncbi:MAG: alpha-L-fucosidase [Eubacteriales bacterium]